MNDKSQEDCRMDNERLREIKHRLENYIYDMSTEAWAMTADGIIKELIIAVEELQAENGQLRRQVTIAQAENTAIEEFIAEHGTIKRTYGRESR